MKPFEAFEKHALEYDAWYDNYGPAYESELLALKQFLPKDTKKLRALEIGVGTGRFAGPLGIGYGVEPARAMAELAKKRGVETVLGVAEALPFKGGSFDLMLIVTSISFFKDPVQGLREAAGALKPGGQIIIGMIDRDSPPGQYYESKSKEGKFSSGAHFLSATELEMKLVKLGFENIETCQTIFKMPEEIDEIETVKQGTGEGLFAVISVWKPAD